jgi:Na+/phosphate symporter
MKTEESQLLYRKYIKSGLTKEQAEERLNQVKEHLKKYVIKLRNKKLSEKDINIRFKEEFSKIAEKI